jgi:hypothetical protein
LVSGVRRNLLMGLKHQICARLKRSCKGQALRNRTGNAGVGLTVFALQDKSFSA